MRRRIDFERERIARELHDTMIQGVQGLILAEIAAIEELDGYAFSPIVAAGANAWEIHHRPDATPLRPGDMVILDLGVIFRGYASDMTRTVCLGEPTPCMREVHDLVAEAQNRAFAEIRAGASSRVVGPSMSSCLPWSGWRITWIWLTRLK